MTLDERELRRMLAVLDTASDSFVVLARVGGVNPKTGFRGADLRGIDFGEDDLTDFDFARADLRGADLSRAKGVTPAMLASARVDATTKAPRGMLSFPPRLPLASWREPIPGLQEEAWPDMVTLPSGSFLMGAPDDEEGSTEDERPQRHVTIARPFAIGRCEVTFAQWDAARAAGASLRKLNDAGWGRANRPAINLSWDEARDYCNWLNGALGLAVTNGYRLPSGAEWEYACRAGTTTPFSFGQTIKTTEANYDGKLTYGHGRKGEYRGRTVPVGSLPANSWGLHEMHGNVWEWVEDAFGPYPNRPTGAKPLQHSDTSARVLRGGSWFSLPKLLRSASRYRYAPSFRAHHVGFRLARTLG